MSDQKKWLEESLGTVRKSDIFGKHNRWSATTMNAENAGVSLRRLRDGEFELIVRSRVPQAREPSRDREALERVLRVVESHLKTPPSNVWQELSDYLHTILGIQKD